jgi:hypothetical protein
MQDLAQPNQLEFPLAKAEYLLSYTTASGEGGDKRKFWHEILGFQSAETIRAEILAKVAPELLQLQGQNPYGTRYAATILIASPSGISWQIRTAWIVLQGQAIARFVTAVPERQGRQP